MKKLILDISQKEKNRILEMYGILLNEGDNCGPLKEPLKSRCELAQGININNGKNVYNWCSTNLQWFVQNEKGAALLATDFERKLNELTALYGVSGGVGAFWSNYKVNWDNLLHICNTGCRYQSNPPSPSCNVFKKPEVQTPEKNAVTEKCPTTERYMLEFIDYCFSGASAGYLKPRSDWFDWTSKAKKDPCGILARQGWFAKLGSPAEYPPKSGKTYKYLGEYWHAIKKEQVKKESDKAWEEKQKQAELEKQRQEDIKMGKVAASDTYSGVDNQVNQQANRMLEYKNTLGRMTPEEQKAFANRVAGENKGSNFNWDLLVDLISALCEFIPGLGSAVSLGIDVIHGIVNVMEGVDYWISQDGENAISKLISGIVGLLTSAIPLAGNMIKQGFNQTIKKVLQVSAKELQALKALDKLDYWSKLLWALIKKAGESLGGDAIFGKVSTAINDVIVKFQGYDFITGPLQTLSAIFDPLVSYAQVPLPQTIQNA